mmetsp:Transcript_5541/g.15470  ORF Transcript_5541/g.15470 Transcript_5541/m.15470 type:complete len:767 (-) Transcript_5541:111-2411(-)
MPMSRAELVAEAVRLADGFDPRILTLDSYLERELGDADSDDADPDRVFLKQAVYTCFRYQPALSVFLELFYYEHAASAARADYTLYRVLAGLVLFRLKELGIAELEAFVMAEDPTKMANLLGYIFNEENLDTTLKQEWIAIFDLEFVENEMIAPLKEVKRRIADLLERLEIKAYGIAEAANKRKEAAGITRLPSKALTKPVSPRLTKPTGRPLPEPMRISQTLHANPEPDCLNNTSVAEIEDANAERFERTLKETVATYEESAVKPFKLHETRSNLEELKAKREAEIQSTLRFDMSHYKRAPSFRKKPIVKQTASSILREDALYKKKQEQEAKIIQAYEAELKDSHSFEIWQKKMRERDANLAKEQVELKRAQARASEHNAKAAMMQRVLDNAAYAETLRAESNSMSEMRKLEGDVVLLQNQQLVSQVQAVREVAPKIAVKNVLNARKQRRDDLKEELEVRRLEHEEELRKEQAVREERIRKLKAEQVFEKPVHVFDPTTHSGKGLLGEMSLVEMQERLEINRVREEEQVKQRRHEIIEHREKKLADLKRREEKLLKLRQVAAETAHKQREARIRREAEQQQRDKEIRDRANAVLLVHTEAKRERIDERHRKLEEEEHKRKKAQMFLGAAQHLVEETRFTQLLKGRDREASERQRESKAEVAAYEAIRKKQNKLERKNRRKVRVAHKAVHDRKQQEFIKARREELEKQKKAMHVKKQTFMAARDEERNAIERIHGLNRYADRITKESLRRSRALAATRSLTRTAAR